eukprot:GILK01000682.1.p1 GENE.GILK01000682.1~~GILK01000682.1.p1  ORF type:complete len:427 (+),score=44.00 GILK01000682.1:37-1317(+)
MMWRRICFIVVLLLPFLATQVMAGARKLSKAKDVCSHLHELTFMRYQAKSVYEVEELESVVPHADCHLIVENKKAKLKNEALGKKAHGLRKISNWVCFNLRAANNRGDKSCIANEFFDTLVTSLRVAYEYTVRLAKLPESITDTDADELIIASDAQSKLAPVLADAVTRLPCFCRLLKLMNIDDEERKSNSAMCHSLLAKPDTEFNLETYGAADVTGAFWNEMFRLPVITLKKAGTCTSKSLTALWEPEDRDNWFACAATYMVNDYEVLLVPKGLMMYHGSRTLPSGAVPDGLTWFGERGTAVDYSQRDWGKVTLRRNNPVRVMIHDFETIKHVFVVRLMLRANNRIMLHHLPRGLDLTQVTRYPSSRLYRESQLKIDREVFGALCPKWQKMGIAGYAETLVDGFHPELMLCNSHGVVTSVRSSFD